MAPEKRNNWRGAFFLVWGHSAVCGTLCPGGFLSVSVLRLSGPAGRASNYNRRLVALGGDCTLMKPNPATTIIYDDVFTVSLLMTLMTVPNIDNTTDIQ